MSLQLPYDYRVWPSLSEKLKVIQQGPGNLDAAFGLLADVYSIFRGQSIPFEQSPFNGLAVFFSKVASKQEQALFLKKTLPAMAEAALMGQSLIPKSGIFKLKQNEEMSQPIYRSFVASLVALGFFCLYRDYGSDMPSLNFDHFMTPAYFQSGYSWQSAKLRMVFNYFSRVKDRNFATPGNVTFRRVVLKSPFTASTLKQSTKPLCKVKIDNNGTIESSGAHTLQADFANAYIGGGVMGSGRVQEEIRFSICPELLASLLFTPKLLDNEAVVISGFEQYSAYSGYSNSLVYAGDLKDRSPRDPSGNIETAMCAIDAEDYSRNDSVQFQARHFMREFNKAFVGFSQPYVGSRSSSRMGTDPYSTEYRRQFSNPVVASRQAKVPGSKGSSAEKRAVATGNWGCGAFSGDPQLKAILQWLAVSEGESEMIYYTFGDQRMEGFDKVVNMFISNRTSVGQLFAQLESICAKICNDKIPPTIFKYLLNRDFSRL